MSFEILKKNSQNAARCGILHTTHGEIRTPAFMPIGTKGAVKTLTSTEVKSLGAEVILANTYHLWLQPGDETIKKAGGLHEFMKWQGPIMTDSGGFQAFSLRPKITEEGVLFRDEISGAEHFLTPELSVHIQNNLGSDITVVLDEFTGEINNYEKVKSTVERTTRWAKRAREVFDGPGLQYGVVQGGIFSELRKQSAEELSKLNFEGYCIGGVAVGGESSQEQYKAVEMSVPYLPEDKPRHLLGVGTPEQIVEAVKRGIDTFDCVMPTRLARHGTVFVGDSSFDIRNSSFREDFSPLDDSCDCEACTKYTKAYLHHLFKSGEMLAFRLLTMHNVRFFIKLMEGIRKDILES